MSTTAGGAPVNDGEPAFSHVTWRILGILGRLMVAAVFLLAAYGKIQDPMSFAQQIQSYRMVPLEVTNLMAFVIPWLEVVLAVLLIATLLRCQARMVSVLLLVVFTIAKVWAEYWDLKISCGCFGTAFAAIERALEGWPGIVLNIILIALLIADGVSERLNCRLGCSANVGRLTPPA